MYNVHASIRSHHSGFASNLKVKELIVAGNLILLGIRSEIIRKWYLLKPTSSWFNSTVLFSSIILALHPPEARRSSISSGMVLQRATCRSDVSDFPRRHKIMRVFVCVYVCCIIFIGRKNLRAGRLGASWTIDNRRTVCVLSFYNTRVSRLNKYATVATAAATAATASELSVVRANERSLYNADVL